MIDAAADTLHKAWRAGIDLPGRGRSSQLDAIAQLERRCWQSFPPA
jgi:hypothetical protein